jgi:hypothetical protein
MTHGAQHSSHGDPLIPSHETEANLPRSMVEVIPQHTRGASGRIWSMPYRLMKHVEMDPQSPLLQFSADTRTTAENTINFIATYAPEELSRWSRSLGTSLIPSYRKMVDATLEFGPTRHPQETLAVTPLTPAPRHITIPRIDSEHWAYRDHYELGHFKSVTDDFARDCDREALSDVSCILSYLSHYNDLAQSYSGGHLEQATENPAFTAPYGTCMALCVFTLKLPSHFLALIHHGIALQFIARTLPIQWQVDRARKNEVNPTSALFDLLTKLYADDFAT